MPITWIFDLDGTIVSHNGHLDVREELLPGVKEFWERLPAHYFVLILSTQSSAYVQQTKAFLAANQIRYDQILFDLPTGERIVINDGKPSGLKTAFAVNTSRDGGLDFRVNIDRDL